MCGGAVAAVRPVPPTLPPERASGRIIPIPRAYVHTSINRCAGFAVEWPESGSQGAGKPATRRFGRDLLKVPPPLDPGTMTGGAAVWSDLQQGRSPHSGRQRRSSAAEVVVESAGSRSLRSAIDSARLGTTQWLRFAGGNWDAAAARRRSKAAAAASQADAVPDDGSYSPVLSPPADSRPQPLSVTVMRAAVCKSTGARPLARVRARLRCGCARSRSGTRHRRCRSPAIPLRT